MLKNRSFNLILKGRKKMKYISTRSDKYVYESAEAIKMGIAPDGGLFVPEKIPCVTKDEIEGFANLTYPELAKKILSLYLTDYTDDELSECVKGAYESGKFESDAVAPLHKLDEKVSVLELWHGPTCAFKDMALQILPHFLVKAIKKTGEDRDVIILVATSGDTGKAALEGFKDVKNTKIQVFYPVCGVSKIQKLQMATQDGSNVSVISVDGNFDDAQTGVKKIFGNEECINEATDLGYVFSSANSINWGRLVPQIVYYFYAYATLVKNGEIKCGDKINIVVPTGNFGNILAAYYAKEMGLFVDRLICASNSNNVLTDFIKTGAYDRNRKFETTISPSMDILISSNLERLLFHMSKGDFKLVKEYMTLLSTDGKYSVNSEIFDKIKSVFSADCCDDCGTKKTIRDTFEKYGYTIDTHTAVAKNVYDKFEAENKSDTKTVIASTANPYKFNKAVLEAICDTPLPEGEFELIDLLCEKSKLPVPKSLSGLKSKFIRFNTVCGKDALWAETKKFLTK